MRLRLSSPRLIVWLAVPGALVLACAGPALAGRFIHWFGPPAAPPSECACFQAPSPEAAVRRVLTAQVEAWNHGDLDAFMAGYWSSPDLSFFSGPDRTSGWQATLDRYRKRYQADGKEMGRLTFSDLDVQVLGPDCALVRGHWQLELSKDKPGGLFTLIFRRLPEGWRIIHDHTSK